MTLTDNRLAGDQLALDYAAAGFTDPAVGAAKAVNVTGIRTAGDAVSVALTRPALVEQTGIVVVSVPSRSSRPARVSTSRCRPRWRRRQGPTRPGSRWPTVRRCRSG